MAKDNGDSKLTAAHMNLDDLVQRGRVHRRVYTDPLIFDMEMELIFERIWMFVGHESEAPRPGDYITGHIGRQPIIMCRHQDGKIYVLMNRCMHQGAVLCREERGNTPFFECIYHGWTYATNGELMKVPEVSGFGADFKQSEFGLLKAPRVGIHRGFVFASLEADGESLKEFLGKAWDFIDLTVDAAPEGSIEVASGVQKYTFPGNWKLQASNLVDAYHSFYVHKTAFQLRDRKSEQATKEPPPEAMKSNFAPGPGVSAPDSETPGAETPGAGDSGASGIDFPGRTENVGLTRSFGRGHAGLAFPGRTGPWHSLAYQFEGYIKKLESVLGPERAKNVLDRYGQILVFPTLFFQNQRQHFRVVRPVAADRTDVYVYPYTLKGAPDELNGLMVQGQGWWSSAAGFGQPDDLEAFVRCQEGFRVAGAEWVLISRGLDRERLLPDGEIVGNITDDVPTRGIFREWKRLLSMERNG